MDPNRLLRELDTRIGELEASVFRAPPGSMEAFQGLRGQWVALTELRTWYHQELNKDIEDDDPDLPHHVPQRHR